MKTRNRFRKKRTTRKHKGGYGETVGFPECTNLSQFVISDYNIQNFSRHFSSPMDCFINALQLYGAIDEMCANLMRISGVGRKGFSKEELEIIFMYITGYNYDFKTTTNYDDFVKQIENNILPGHAVFSGYQDIYEGKSISHVFIIAKTSDNKIVYIDPQIPIICDVEMCQNLYLRQHQTWYLLFNSTIKLNNFQIQYVKNQVPFLKNA